MHLAVELLGFEAEHVLAVELLRDARERRRQIGGFLQLEVAAAGFVGQLLQPAVGLAPHHPRAVEVFALESDRVDHHFFGARAIEHRARPTRLRRVVAVGEDQDHAPALDALQRVEARR